MKPEHAVIMAAGTSSRFAPLSYEKPKALITVRGEVLIERQIRQLQEAGVPDIVVVTGYKAEQFAYLSERFGVRLVHNAEYRKRNNHSSVRAVREYLKNAYLCSADNYFTENPFLAEPEGAYYAAEYADGETAEWCMEEDEEGFISRVTIGGENAWYMLGHTFWSAEFAERFLQILDAEYDLPETAGKLWEKIFMEHLDVLKMTIRRYAPGVIFEFDTLDELREFDPTYRTDTRSAILKRIAKELGVGEEELVGLQAIKGKTTEAEGFAFECRGEKYEYEYKSVCHPEE